MWNIEEWELEYGHGFSCEVSSKTIPTSTLAFAEFYCRVFYAMYLDFYCIF